MAKSSSHLSKEFISSSDEDSTPTTPSDSKPTMQDAPLSSPASSSKRPRKEASQEEPPSSQTSQLSITVKRNKDGEPFVDLSAKRRLTLRKWRSSLLIDLREFYAGSDGEDLPGKKGISLSLDQWNRLKESMGEVDRLIREMQ